MNVKQLRVVLGQAQPCKEGLNGLVEVYQFHGFWFFQSAQREWIIGTEREWKNDDFLKSDKISV
jgi:hypothetical protein